jgi:ribonuclease HI
MRFVAYTDGSGMSRGGPAGAAFVILADDCEFTEWRVPLAYANHHVAELLAATLALESLPEGQHVKLVSDSSLVVKGWDWKIKKHLDHWERFKAARARHASVDFEWIKRNSCVENKRADHLAGEARLLAEQAARTRGQGVD